jgi:aldose 1-epimerase
MHVSTREFGRTQAGDPVASFRISNDSGCTVTVIELGAILQSVQVPDRAGVAGEIALGYDDVASYEVNKPHLGAAIGRFANRIEHGVFELDGNEYRLEKNDGGKRHLHGGSGGFGKRLWHGEITEDAARSGVRMTYVSEAGEAGYPGRLSVSVTYLLDERSQLTMRYAAETDAATIINLTNHSYWNLADGGLSSVEQHRLQVDAARYLVATDHVPTGNIAEVAGTPFDFRQPQALGKAIAATGLFGGAGGYDVSYVVDGVEGELRNCAAVDAPETGRRMEVLTTQPGVQLYSAEFLVDEAGRGGATYQPRTALCLETQHHPDSPHHTHFPSVVLRPGTTYRETTVHRFSTF